MAHQGLRRTMRLAVNFGKFAVEPTPPLLAQSASRPGVAMALRYGFTRNFGIKIMENVEALEYDVVQGRLNMLGASVCWIHDDEKVAVGRWLGRRCVSCQGHGLGQHISQYGLQDSCELLTPLRKDKQRRNHETWRSVPVRLIRAHVLASESKPSAYEAWSKLLKGVVV